MLLALLALATSAWSQPRVLAARYNGIITPVAAEYLTSAIEKARADHDDGVVIELDTPGGLDLSMRDIVKAELSSDIPVIVYVSPAGARAASAGVFITMAANVAAMAPGTNIGAAHPVELGGASGSSEKKGDSVMQEKIAHDAVAYLQAIAQKRNRNASWATEVVEKSTSIPSALAVKERVVDLEAASLDEVLRFAKLPGAQIVKFEMTGRQRALAAVSDPNIAMILMSVGVAGIMIELYSPGLILPGIVGAVSLVVAFYSFQTLSANLAGVLLIALGMMFFLLEFKVHAFGLLVLSGIGAFLFGALMLFKDSAGGVSISNNVLFSTVGTMSVVLIALLTLAKRVLGRKARTGAEGLVGQKGVALDKSRVRVAGEIWETDSVDLEKGSQVVVSAVDGLTLKVRKR